MEFGNFCLWPKERVPQEVLACAFTMHNMPGQPVCTPKPSPGWRCHTRPGKPSSEWAVIVYHALLVALQTFLGLRESAHCVRLAIQGMSGI